MVRTASLLLIAAGLVLTQTGGCPVITDIVVPGVKVQTSAGSFTVALDPNSAPGAVTALLAYADSGFYTETLFHSATPQAVEAGRFELALTQKETRDPIANEAAQTASNTRGTIAMARTDDPDSATSQFFINLSDNGELDAGNSNFGYAVFGTVLDGMSTVDAIAALETEDRDGLSDVPQVLVTITAAARESVNPGTGPVEGVRLTTTAGDILIALDAVSAPLSVANFLQYVDEEFYVGTVFHRVLADFVIQGGGFELRGLAEKPAVLPTIDTSADEVGAPARGSVSLLDNGSTLFAPAAFRVNVTDDPNAPADGTVVGVVTEGLDVIDAIAGSATETRGDQADVPVDDVVIESVELVEVNLGQGLSPEARAYFDNLGYRIAVTTRTVLVDLGSLLLYQLWTGL